MTSGHRDVSMQPMRTQGLAPNAIYEKDLTRVHGRRCCVVHTLTLNASYWSSS